MVALRAKVWRIIKQPSSMHVFTCSILTTKTLLHNAFAIVMRAFPVLPWSLVVDTFH